LDDTRVDVDTSGTYSNTLERRDAVGSASTCFVGISGATVRTIGVVRNRYDRLRKTTGAVRWGDGPERVICASCFAEFLCDFGDRGDQVCEPSWVATEVGAVRSVGVGSGCVL
jgi:hypothetical protein